MTLFLGRSRIVGFVGPSQKIDESLFTHVKLADGSSLQLDFSASLAELPEFLSGQIPKDDVVEVHSGNAVARGDCLSLDFSQFSSLTTFAFPDNVPIQLHGTVQLPSAYEVIVPRCIDVQKEADLRVGPQTAVYVEGLTYEKYSQERGTGKWRGLDANLKFEPVADTQIWYSDGTFASYQVSGKLSYNDISAGFSAEKTVSRLAIGSNVIEVDEKLGTSITESQTSGLTSFALSPKMQSSGSCFSMTALQSLDIPDGVRRIDGLFLQPQNDVQSQLSVVHVPDSVSSIESQAFRYSRQLKAVVLGAGLKRLGQYAFESCTSLEDVVFKGDQLQTVETYCFQGTHLHEVKLPDSVTAIGDYAYSSIGDALTSVTLPSSLTGLGSHAFTGAHISELSVPDSCRLIGSSAFSKCTKLSTLSFGAGLTSIGTSAFSDTYGLEGQDIVVPSELKQLGKSCFESCYAKSFDLSKTKLIEISPYTFKFASLERISLPQTLRAIGTQAFRACSKLSTLSIPSNVTKIAEDAFLYSTDHLSVHFEGKSRQQVMWSPGYPWGLRELWMTFG